MSKRNLKIMILINTAFIIICIALGFYDGKKLIEAGGPIVDLLTYNAVAGIMGSVVDIMLWAVIWLTDITISKVVQVVSYIIGACGLCLMLGILLFNIIIMAFAWFGVVVFVNSLVFLIVALAIEKKRYGYLGYIVAMLFVACVVFD